MYIKPFVRIFLLLPSQMIHTERTTTTYKHVDQINHYNVNLVIARMEFSV